ncbi:MAG: hypothetical protein KGL35_30520 [Bradyrhizobium sp.]|nr:hypothetical protein [Bradyrhizobium sp.]
MLKRAKRLRPSKQIVKAKDAPAPEAKRKPNAPLLPIDNGQVERAASLGCTVEEIAVLVGVGRSTFLQRVIDDPDLAECLERGRAMGKSTLRRLQWKLAQEGNPTMLIWLGKQLLGQKDRHEHSGDPAAPMAPTAAIINVYVAPERER